MIKIRNMEEMEKYYLKETNTYVFEDDVEFLCDVNVKSNLKAFGINAYGINAYNIYACDINADDIDAWDIKARNVKAWEVNAWEITAHNIRVHKIEALDIDAYNISYFVLCFAYYNIHCNSIRGRHPNSKHFVLEGELIVRGEK